MLSILSYRWPFKSHAIQKVKKIPTDFTKMVVLQYATKKIEINKTKPDNLVFEHPTNEFWHQYNEYAKHLILTDPDSFDYAPIKRCLKESIPTNFVCLFQKHIDYLDTGYRTKLCEKIAFDLKKINGKFIFDDTIHTYLEIEKIMQ